MRQQYPSLTENDYVSIVTELSKALTEPEDTRNAKFIEILAPYFPTINSNRDENGQLRDNLATVFINYPWHYNFQETDPFFNLLNQAWIFLREEFEPTKKVREYILKKCGGLLNERKITNKEKIKFLKNIQNKFTYQFNSIDHTRLANYINQYLTLQGVPQKPADDNLRKMLSYDGGTCHGFAVCYAAFNAVGKGAWWNQLLYLMGRWDGTKEGLEKEYTIIDSDDPTPKKLDYFIDLVINYIALTQSINLPTNFCRLLTNDQEDFLSPWNKKESKIHFEVYTKRDIQEYDGKQIITPKRIAKKNSFAGHFTSDQLAIFLNTHQHLISNKDVMCFINNCDHDSVVRYNPQTTSWYFYEANHHSGDISFNSSEELSQYVCTNFDDDIFIQFVSLDASIDLTIKPVHEPTDLSLLDGTGITMILTNNWSEWDSIEKTLQQKNNPLFLEKIVNYLGGNDKKFMSGTYQLLNYNLLKKYLDQIKASNQSDFIQQARINIVSALRVIPKRDKTAWLDYILQKYAYLFNFFSLLEFINEDSSSAKQACQNLIYLLSKTYESKTGFQYIFEANPQKLFQTFDFFMGLIDHKDRSRFLTKENVHALVTGMDDLLSLEKSDEHLNKLYEYRLKIFITYFNDYLSNDSFFHKNPECISILHNIIKDSITLAEKIYETIINTCKNLDKISLLVLENLLAIIGQDNNIKIQGHICSSLVASFFYDNSKLSNDAYKLFMGFFKQYPKLQITLYKKIASSERSLQCFLSQHPSLKNLFQICPLITCNDLKNFIKDYITKIIVKNPSCNEAINLFFIFYSNDLKSLLLSLTQNSDVMNSFISTATTVALQDNHHHRLTLLLKHARNYLPQILELIDNYKSKDIKSTIFPTLINLFFDDDNDLLYIHFNKIMNFTKTHPSLSAILYQKIACSEKLILLFLSQQLEILPEQPDISGLLEICSLIKNRYALEKLMQDTLIVMVVEKPSSIELINVFFTYYPDQTPSLLSALKKKPKALQEVITKSTTIILQSKDIHKLTLLCEQACDQLPQIVETIDQHSNIHEKNKALSDLIHLFFNTNRNLSAFTFNTLLDVIKKSPESAIALYQAIATSKNLNLLALFLSQQPDIIDLTAVCQFLETDELKILMKKHLINRILANSTSDTEINLFLKYYSNQKSRLSFLSQNSILMGNFFTTADILHKQGKPLFRLLLLSDQINEYIPNILDIIHKQNNSTTENHSICSALIELFLHEHSELSIASFNALINFIIQHESTSVTLYRKIATSEKLLTLFLSQQPDARALSEIRQSLVSSELKNIMQQHLIERIRAEPSSTEIINLFFNYYESKLACLLSSLQNTSALPLFIKSLITLTPKNNLDCAKLALLIERAGDHLSQVLSITFEQLGNHLDNFLSSTEGDFNTAISNKIQLELAAWRCTPREHKPESSRPSSPASSGIFSTSYQQLSPASSANHLSGTVSPTLSQ